MENQDQAYQDGSSLEGSDTIPIQGASTEPPETEPQPPNFGTPKLFSLRRVLLIGGLVLLLIIVGVVIALATKPAKKPAPTTIVVNTQSLDNGTLSKLTAQSGNAGQANQQLTISPDTLFKSSVDVQGNLAVKGTSTLQGAVSTGNLTVHGNLSVSGQITAVSLSVGTITISTLNLSGDLNIGGHLVPNGGLPTVKPSVGASGGSATISGNDTAGTVTITIGGSQLIAGEMAIISFHKPFGLTPKVQLTPVNAAAASLKYYVSQSPTFFTIESASVPISGSQYTFNYFVTQ